MHLGLSVLLKFYREHSADQALVLGTVTATEGSTYRKPGAMMLIAADGSHCGLISGGCLEADLALHAEQVFEDGQTREMNYDLSAGDELVWSLGLGCDGIIHLMLQRLEGSQGFGFLETLDQAWQQRCDGVLGLVISSSDKDFPQGTFRLDCGAGTAAGDPNLLKDVQRPSEMHDMSKRYWRENISTEGGSTRLLLLPIIPPPSLLICGAGIDAVPVARLAVEMGWYCTIVDHRSGFARADRFPSACNVCLMQPAELAGNLDLDHIDAVVMMSHNLAHDRQYLSQVVRAGISYVGLLGPRARRDRLLDEIDSDTLSVHVHGPAGLDIGAEMPESIALAIISEIHASLNRRHGGELTPAGT
jgi:xanthine dehydrogenase accessory factor